MLQKSRSSVSEGVNASTPARHVPANPAPKGKRAGKGHPMEIFSVGKKKGQATTANPSATQCGSKEKPALFSTLHISLCNSPRASHIDYWTMLDFFNDRAQPSGDACTISGTESWRRFCPLWPGDGIFQGRPNRTGACRIQKASGTPSRLYERLLYCRTDAGAQRPHR